MCARYALQVIEKQFALKYLNSQVHCCNLPSQPVCLDRVPRFFVYAVFSDHCDDGDGGDDDDDGCN